MKRLKWDELNSSAKAFYKRDVDLEEGETMADWWEAWMDSIQEDGSYRTDGWPGWEA